MGMLAQELHTGRDRHSEDSADCTANSAARNQRRSPRVPVQRPVRIGLSSGTSVSGLLVNLSIGGAGFVYEAPAQIGAVLHFAFVLNWANQTHLIKAAGTVRHCHLTPKGFFTGVEWQNLDEEGAAVVQAFVGDRIRLRYCY